MDEFDAAQMRAIHIQIVFVRFDSVGRDAFLDPEVLKESIAPLLISHTEIDFLNFTTPATQPSYFCYSRSPGRALLTARSSASSRVCKSEAVAKYVAVPAAIVTANAITFCIMRPA